MNRRDWLGLSALGLTAAAAATASARANEASSGPVPLDANENPFGPTVGAMDAFASAASRASRYPVPELIALKAAIARKEGLTPDHVVVGSGSGEILSAAALAWRADRGNIVSAASTFEQLPDYAERLGTRISRVSMDSKLRHDLEGMANAVNRRTQLVYVCNPNNPTGTMVTSENLRDFVRDVGKRSVVFVDEAYIELQLEQERESMVDLVREGENIVVAKTFSKLHGLAGLRVGYGLAPPKLAEKLRASKMSLPNGPGMAAATVSLSNAGEIGHRRERIEAIREWFSRKCRQRGLETSESHGNFVFVRTGIDATDFQRKMKGKGFLVGRAFPPYLQWSRISVGTHHQMGAAMTAIEEVLSLT